jgi:hypothetical protein
MPASTRSTQQESARKGKSKQNKREVEKKSTNRGIEIATLPLR